MASMMDAIFPAMTALTGPIAAGSILAWLMLSGVLLDLLDISLPRGDSVGVSGAVFAAGMLIADPAAIGFLAVISVVLSHVVRMGSASSSRMVGLLVSRAAALLASYQMVTLAPMVGLAGMMPIVVPAVYLAVELTVAQLQASVISGRSLGRLLVGSARSQAPLLVAQWSAAVLLLVTFGGMGAWSLIPVVALLLLMRQSYALFLDIRETYRTTVEVLVEAAESQDRRRVGHADRTASVARAIAMSMGLPAGEVERISYAALLHDLGELSLEAGAEGDVSAVVPPADIVSGVAFFDPVERILRACDGRRSDCSQDDMRAALIVALASDIDANSDEAVFAAHGGRQMRQMLLGVEPTLLARVSNVALQLGYQIPLVN